MNVTACMTPIYRNITLPLTVMPTGWWCRSMRRQKLLMLTKRVSVCFDIIAATISVLGIAPNKLVLKTRERQKGKNQYQKLGEKGEFL